MILYKQEKERVVTASAARISSIAFQMVFLIARFAFAKSIIYIIVCSLPSHQCFLSAYFTHLVLRQQLRYIDTPPKDHCSL